MSQHWNEVQRQFGERMNAFKKHANSVQGGPIGTVPRSAQQQAALWKKITALPDTELDGFMNSLMANAEHQNGETQPCDGCRFVLRHVPKGA